MQIVAYPEGRENSYEAFNFLIEEPKTVQIKMEKYVLIGPFLVETSAMATFIIVLLAIILFVTVEVYRRKRSISDNSKS